jgi:hypothetical protein
VVNIVNPAGIPSFTTAILETPREGFPFQSVGPAVAQDQVALFDGEDVVEGSM